MFSYGFQRFRLVLILDGVVVVGSIMDHFGDLAEFGRCLSMSVDFLSFGFADLCISDFWDLWDLGFWCFGSLVFEFLVCWLSVVCFDFCVLGFVYAVFV